MCVILLPLPKVRRSEPKGRESVVIPFVVVVVVIVVAWPLVKRGTGAGSKARRAAYSDVAPFSLFHVNPCMCPRLFLYMCVCVCLFLLLYYAPCVSRPPSSVPLFSSCFILFSSLILSFLLALPTFCTFVFLFMFAALRICFPVFCLILSFHSFPFPLLLFLALCVPFFPCSMLLFLFHFLPASCLCSFPSFISLPCLAYSGALVRRQRQQSSTNCTIVFVFVCVCVCVCVAFAWLDLHNLASRNCFRPTLNRELSRASFDLPGGRRERARAPYIPTATFRFVCAFLPMCKINAKGSGSCLPAIPTSVCALHSRSCRVCPIGPGVRGRAISY